MYISNQNHLAIGFCQEATVCQLRPTMANNGQQWPTMTNNGQQWPTMTNNGQQWPTMANNGQQWPSKPRSRSLRMKSFPRVHLVSCMDNIFNSSPPFLTRVLRDSVFTLIFFYKNQVYKNVRLQIVKNLRTC